MRRVEAAVRRPVLRAERLTELAGDDLRALAGAAISGSACSRLPALWSEVLKCDFGASAASCICTMNCGG